MDRQRPALERHAVRTGACSGTNAGADWDDAHNDLTGSHNRMAGKTDKPIADCQAT